MGNTRHEGKVIAMSRNESQRPRLGLKVLVPTLLLASGLTTGGWWLAESLVLTQTVSEGRTVADLAENVGRWASQYGGIHVRTVGANAQIPGSFLTRSVYAPTDGDNNVLQGARVEGVMAERAAMERVESYHWKNPALIQREVADVITASGSKARYRMTARTVLNKNNEANDFEREALDAIQASIDRHGGVVAGGAKLQHGVADPSREYWKIKSGQLLYARSVVAQPSCLRCHDKSDTAPEFMRTNVQFSGGGGFGYVAGKPAGLISVSVPLPPTAAALTANVPLQAWAGLAAAVLGALWLLTLAFRRPR
jgi:hypothetical protein